MRQHREREVLKHTILKAANAWKLEDLPAGRWAAEDAKLEAALYPDRQEPRPATAGPVKSQWELYHELKASGRLAEIERTRHLRSGGGFENLKDVQRWLTSR